MFFEDTIEKLDLFSNCCTITNARVVTPNGVLDDVSVDIVDGRIANIDDRPCGIGRSIDAQGNYLLPGFIDIHSDAIEKGIEPRPNTFFPVNIALFELDKKIVACGITTMFHSLSFAELEVGLRNNSMASQIIREIRTLSPQLKVNTRIHARYEITDQGALPFLHELIAEKQIDLLSLMDHSPGQGQFRDYASFKNYYGKVYKKSDAEIHAIINRKLQTKATIQSDSIEHLVRLCTLYHIPLASHDDDCQEKIAWLKDLGICLSEFPINMETAQAAHEAGISICLGAPNVLRGCSQAGNLSAREAIKAGFGTLLCSDYSPMTMLHAVFSLFSQEILPLHTAINMVSLNPARAAGLSEKTGSISLGKDADLVLVRYQRGFAEVLKTFVRGKEVFSTC